MGVCKGMVWRASPQRAEGSLLLSFQNWLARPEASIGARLFVVFSIRYVAVNQTPLSVLLCHLVAFGARGIARVARGECSEFDAIFRVQKLTGLERVCSEAEDG